MRIMVVTPYLPHKRVGHGGGTAVRDLVKHLAFDNDVLLVSLIRPGEDQDISDVEELGVRVAAITFNDARSHGFSKLALSWDRLGSWFRSLTSGYPHYVEKYWSPKASNQIITLVKDFKPQAVQFEYLQMALLARDLKHWRDEHTLSSPRIILNTHELGSIPRRRQATQASAVVIQWKANQEALHWEKLQLAACQWADKILCVTPEDEAAYKALGGSNLLTVPLGMDLEAIRPDRQPATPGVCLFVGSFNHRPNVLAATLLVNEIWPQVHAKAPEIKLTLVGRGSDVFLNEIALPQTQLTQMGISATGFVDDLSPFFRESKLFIAPLPEGGGIKIKILEAMARGIPVITTEIGAEGIAREQDKVMIITDHQDGFAKAVLLALEDLEIEENALRARILMENKFSWKAIAKRLIDIYQS